MLFSVPFLQFPNPAYTYKYFTLLSILEQITRYPAINECHKLGYHLNCYLHNNVITVYDKKCSKYMHLYDHKNHFMQQAHEKLTEIHLCASCKINILSLISQRYYNFYKGPERCLVM